MQFECFDYDHIVSAVAKLIFTTANKLNHISVETNFKCQ